jgi:integrase
MATRARKSASYLHWHGQSWRVQLAVPARLKEAIGCAVLYHPLHTDSLAIAERTKHRAIATLKDRLAAAEGALKRRAGGDPLLAEGLDWRQSFKDEAQRASNDEEGVYVSTALEARWEEVAKAQGEEKANILASIATGRATPIGSLADQWLAEKPLKGKQRLDYRRAVAKLETWMADKSLPPTLQAITKQTAASYRDEAFVRAGVHSRSANKDLSALSGLWKHAERKDLVIGNPWRGQFLPQSTASSSHKRPLTSDEVNRLLAALATPQTPMQGLLRDTVAVLACSALRVEEWATMKVTDLRDLTGPLPYVVLRGTKTASARRDVPIHPDLLPIIHRRATEAGPEGYLVGELNTPPEGSAWGRGQPITKEFGRLRKRLGIDEREAGARQANVDLHSLRRFAIASMRDALNAGATGYSMRTVAQLVGHDVGDLGLSMTSMYAGQEPLSAKAAAIGAIRLPTIGEYA